MTDSTTPPTDGSEPPERPAPVHVMPADIGSTLEPKIDPVTGEVILPPWHGAVVYTNEEAEAEFRRNEVDPNDIEERERLAVINVTGKRKLDEIVQELDDMAMGKTPVIVDGRTGLPNLAIVKELEKRRRDISRVPPPLLLDDGTPAPDFASSTEWRDMMGKRVRTDEMVELLLPEGYIGNMVAAQSVGKSLFAVYLAACLAVGPEASPYLYGLRIPRPRASLYLAVEDPEGVIQRLEVLKQEHEWLTDEAVARVSITIRRFNIVSAEGQFEVLRIVKAWHAHCAAQGLEPGFIFLDTQRQFINGAGSSNNDEVTAIMTNVMAEVKEAAGGKVCVIAAVHTNKSNNKRAAGSAEQEQSRDITIVMTREKAELTGTISITKHKMRQASNDSRLPVGTYSSHAALLEPTAAEIELEERLKSEGYSPGPAVPIPYFIPEAAGAEAVKEAEASLATLLALGESVMDSVDTRVRTGLDRVREMGLPTLWKKKDIGATMNGSDLATAEQSGMLIRLTRDIMIDRYGCDPHSLPDELKRRDQSAYCFPSDLPSIVRLYKGTLTDDVPSPEPPPDGGTPTLSVVPTAPSYLDETRQEENDDDT